MNVALATATVAARGPEGLGAPTLSDTRARTSTGWLLNIGRQGDAEHRALTEQIAVDADVLDPDAADCSSQTPPHGPP